MFSKCFISLSALALGLLLIVSVGTGYGEVVEEARITVDCGMHVVDILDVNFTFNGSPVYNDPAPAIGCASTGATKLYTFPIALDINDFECVYTADGGDPTTIVLPAGQFYFHYPLVLPTPSPGGTLNPPPGAPASGDAWMVISDHDVLMWPSSECFRFTGAQYDYVCVTWYCETMFEPVFQITPGCDSPCGDPSCPPAVYESVAWAPACNPVPNIFCRLFWPVGLTTPGCWCYNFEYQLPVELSSFDAVPTASAISLRFTTASELDNAHFEIMRGESEDGSFTEIARIASQGDATNEQVYSFTDTEVNAGTTYYYFLAEQDLQGNRNEHRDLMVSAVTTGSVEMPNAYALAAYPNPFNPTTTLSFTLAIAGRADISVFNAAGQLVERMAGATYEAGTHEVGFDAAALPSGIYIAHLEANDHSASTKLLLIK
jgi:hypothetical protein